MTFFYEFIRQTYFYIIILIGILMAMNSMFWVDSFSKKRIKWTMFFLSIIVFVDFLAEYFSNLKDCKKVFLVISALYLILKPVLTIILMRLVTSRYNRAYWILVIINCASVIVRFCYGNNDDILYTTVVIISIICNLLLVAFLLHAGLAFIRTTNFRESQLLVFILVNVIVTLLLGVIDEEARLLNPIYAINVLFYLIYLHNENSKRDTLTKVFNRHTLYSDIEQIGNKINGVIMFDINSFKQINDKYGHDVGDKILVAIAQKANSRLNSGSRLYRTGGDEFVIVSRKSKKEIVYISELIKQDFIEMGYPCAVGVKLRKDDILPVEEMIKESDKEMYKDKVEMKRKQGLQ